MIKTQLSIQELLGNDQKLTFLIGAGCSVDTPSNQPAGRSMKDAMIQFACDKDEIAKISKLEELRFESLVEILRDNIDEDLKLIDFYGECDKPNLQHFFLASMILKGHFVMTTNFDFLIELALLQMNVPREQIKVIIMAKEKEKMKLNKIGFIGLGLIGGSIAKAIKKYYPDSKIYGTAYHSETVREAYEDGIILNNDPLPIDFFSARPDR